MVTQQFPRAHRAPAKVVLPARSPSGQVGTPMHLTSGSDLGIPIHGKTVLSCYLQDTANEAEVSA